MKAKHAAVKQNDFMSMCGAFYFLFSVAVLISNC